MGPGDLCISVCHVSGPAGRAAKRDIQLIEQRGQSADHPILAGMPETWYLKCFIVQVL
ncbi:MAG: hypothetical protein LV473_20095 [Nitrospira sp.]|nr:hypothetical protein [Nitrospira sp.]